MVGRSGSDSFDGYALCVRRKRFQIDWVGSQYRTAWLGERDDERVRETKVWQRRKMTIKPFF